MKISVAAQSEQIRVIKWSKLMQFPFGNSWIIQLLWGNGEKKWFHVRRPERTDGGRTADGRCACRAASCESSEWNNISKNNISFIPECIFLHFHLIFRYTPLRIHTLCGFFMKIEENSEFHEARMNVGERKNRKCSVIKIEKIWNVNVKIKRKIMKRKHQIDTILDTSEIIAKHFHIFCTLRNSRRCV